MNPEEHAGSTPATGTLFTCLYSSKAVKVGYVFCAAVIILVIALWIIGPIVIEQVYHGKSLSFLNSVMAGRGGNSLSENFSAFYRIMALATVVVLWPVALWGHMIWRGQADSRHYMERNSTDSTSRFRWLVSVSLYSVLILSSIYTLVVFHGSTYISIMIHDVFIYFDGSYRLDMGQVPHKDFHTPLGFAGYLIPYWGLLLKESYAGSLELASFLVAVAVTLFSIPLLRGRSSALFAVLTIAYLCLLVAVPMNAGTDGKLVTHAMYYNRWAWAVLTLVLITYIAPETFSNKRLVLETILLGFLISLLFFLKVTYFVFALTFLLVLASASRPQRYLAVGAGAMAFVFWAFIEWRFSITGPYLDDVWMAITSSGAVRPRILANVADNIVEILLVTIAVGILILRRAVRWPDLLFVAFVGVAGLAIINQNKQSENIVVFLAILMWSYAAASRSEEGGESSMPVTGAGDAQVMGILLVLFIAPPLLSGVRGMTSLTVGLASAGQRGEVAILPGLYISQQYSLLGKVDAGVDPVTLFKDLRRRRTTHHLSQGEYVETIYEGLQLLDAQEVRPGKIVNLDMANPFNFLIGGQPPTGDYAWFHAGRLISRRAHVAATTLFRDVDYVMVPLFPIFPGTSRVLWDIYGDHVQKEYELLAKSKWWTLYGRSE